MLVPFSSRLNAQLSRGRAIKSARPAGQSFEGSGAFRETKKRAVGGSEGKGSEEDLRRLGSAAMRGDEVLKTSHRVLEVEPWDKMR
jgi:hypothetical protein